MIRPEHNVIEVLARIGNSNDGEVLLKWIESSVKDAMDNLMSTHEIHLMHRGQGAIKELTNIQKAFSDSKDFVRTHK